MIQTFRLAQIDRNLLSAITSKQGNKTNSETLRKLIRKEYTLLAETKKTKLKANRLPTPGESMFITSESHLHLKKQK